MRFFRGLWAAVLGFAVAGAAAADDGDRLVLKGPGGVEFSFQRVDVDGGSGPLAGRVFTMGNDDGGFRTPRTRVTVGGAFAGTEGRYYYLGTTEVTNRQYRAVMGDVVKGDDDLPVVGISWIDAQNFIDRLNRHLFDKELKSLPRSGAYPGFVRLPSEEEWEFAARGGTKVDLMVFEADLPYDEEEELAAYEWFSGPESSHGKIQKVGKLKPNPLGLYDMLGNVQEMTSSLYRVEYYQGRSGGFAARGGHYLTNEDDMVVSKRSEEPFYLGSADKGMKPNVKPTMGFRLALGVPILTDNKAIAELEKNWKTHRSTAGADMPAALSVAPVSDREKVSADEALQRLTRIAAVLEKSGQINAVRKELEGTRSALTDMVNVRKKADEDSAKAWVKIACDRGMYLALNIQKLELVKDAPTENLRMKAEEFRYNVTVLITSYNEIMAEMIKLPREAVLKGFDEHTVDIRRQLEKATEERITRDLGLQIRRIDITRRHYEAYEKAKRGDAQVWIQDYLNSKGE